MRLRRETGDFSIKFSILERECQIRKGLGAEDLIGAVIKNGVINRALMGVVTGTVVDGSGKITLVCVDAAAKEGATFKYDPVTGIVSYIEST